MKHRISRLCIKCSRIIFHHLPTRLVMAVVLCILVHPTLQAEKISKDEARHKIQSFHNRAKVMAKPAINVSALRSVTLPEDLIIDGEEPFYVFSGQDCFFIVAAESEYGDVIAYSTENNFDFADMAPEAQYMLEYYKGQIMSVWNNGGNASRKTTYFGTSKLLKTANLGQNGMFWWDACPTVNGKKCYAGCGPAAMAIVMKYHGWPHSGEGMNSVVFNGQQYTVNFAAHTYDWDIIPNESPYNMSWSSAAQDEIAKILYHCGIATDSEYSTTGTSTFSYQIGLNLVRHFKYKVYRNSWNYIDYSYQEFREQYSDYEWDALLKNEIDNNRPCILLGSKGASSHIFVCDGYDSEGMFHFNLGWSGTSNGYYSMNSVDGTYNVSIAVIGIEPDKSKTDDNPSDGGGGAFGNHEYVDLGLPSGLCWATTNLGADTPESFGDYYAWGETMTKSNYAWSTYIYCNGTEDAITKYTTGNVNLSASDDAATVNWGSDWRMPTVSEMNELRSYCNWTYTTKNGVYGYSVVGRNGNSIFLPTAGMTNYSWHTNEDQGRYWTSTLSPNNVTYASYLLFDSSSYKWYMVNRSYGHSVRPVYQGIPNSISVITSEESSSYMPTYNINGMRVDDNYRGIVIKNGKKVIRR